MLEVRGLTKAYNGISLLRGISFTVSQNETICLLGASGSGKSSLLKMIAGLESPDDGLILFNGLDLAQTPAHLRRFGLVFQDYGLFPHLNIFDNIAFGLKMRNFPLHQIHKRVDELLELVNLHGFANRKVTDLSGGEQQRVALARALAPNPRLIMFDEPLGALDKSLKDELLNQLRSILQQTKVPAIYVTHDQDEAFAIADRILLLNDGQIIRDGTPEEVWKNPKSAAAARMMGIGNVIEGEVISAKKVKTEFGIFDLPCNHQHQKGEKISILLHQPPSPFRRGAGGEVRREMTLTVEDVLFKRDQFEVRTRGGIIVHLKDAPKIGQLIKVMLRVQCLA